MRKVIVVFPDWDHLNKFVNAYFLREALVDQSRAAITAWLSEKHVFIACTEYLGYIEKIW